MKIRRLRFNIYLSIGILAALLASGCHSVPADKKPPKKGYGVLRLHIETNVDGTDKNGTVMIGRREPFPLNVNKLPFIEETQFARVSRTDDGMGGFGLSVQLDRQGTWLLEQYTVAKKGRRIAVFAELEDFHWIAAPVITKRITNGVFAFTPDASREEVDKLVLGLNHRIKKLRGQNTINEPEVK
jgi:hypothetical protein